MQTLSHQQLREITQKVEIFVQCRDLADKDILSKSDPFVTLKMMNYTTRQFENKGKTETVRDNLNPNFTKSFLLDYVFEFRQDLIFEVFDGDSEGKTNYLGKATTSVGEVVGAKNQTLILDLKEETKKKAKGKIILRCENVQECEDLVKLQLKSHNIKNMAGCCGNSMIKLRFHRVNENDMNFLVHQSEEQQITNKSWKQIQFNVQKFCNGDINRPVKVECVQAGKIIGNTNFSIFQLGQGDKIFTLRDNSNNEVGQIHVVFFEQIKKPTFLQYIRAGVQLNVSLAVDFTGSNRDYADEQSLHYIGKTNCYQHALKAVSEILLDYDYDKWVPCMGFGAKWRDTPNQQVDHCFAMNRNIQNPNAYGVEGILETYKNCLPNLQFYGPTLFQPLLTSCVDQVNEAMNTPGGELIYTVLMILTDGEIHDMDATVNRLVQASTSPLSVIIIGIGEEQFTKMKILDGDQGLRSQYGQTATRDLTQFVRYNDFRNDPIELAKQVLMEIPEQLRKYYSMKNLTPEQIQQVDQNQKQQQQQYQQQLQQQQQQQQIVNNNDINIQMQQQQNNNYIQQGQNYNIEMQNMQQQQEQQQQQIPLNPFGN